MKKTSPCFFPIPFLRSLKYLDFRDTYAIKNVIMIEARPFYRADLVLRTRAICQKWQPYV